MIDVDGHFYLNLYYYLYLTRRFEEVVCDQYKEGNLQEKPMTSIGQEAIAVGATYCLEKSDYVLPALRTRGAFLTKGITAKQLLVELHRKREAVSKGRWTAHHMGHLESGVILSSAVVSGTIPVALGTALSSKIRNTHQVTIAFFGDGGSSTGAIHEAMNFAAVMNLPIIFVCENNRYSLSLPIQKQMKNENIADRAIGYGMEGAIVDGQDVIEVVYSVQRAIHRARRGDGPSLIECKTYHFRGHSESHPPDDGRPVEELSYWRARCPIELYRNYLVENGVDANEIENIKQRVEKEMSDAIEYVEKCSPPSSSQIGMEVYA